jgi:serine/threonine protein kinase
MEPASDDDRTVLPGQLRAIAVGDRLRDWQIESFLGSGSFGTVWKARRSRLGGYQVAAVKILDRFMVGNVREQLIAEFNLLSSIEHPNLLRYLDAFEIEDGRLAGFVVFVLELADTDLRNAIAESSTGLPEKDLCTAFSALASGLAAFHALGHAHGDIKPANILRVGNVWKLADFGIAAPLDGSYSLVGGTTFDYCPPEELLGVVDPLNTVPETGGRRLHRTADVWSLAISLHYAIAKRHPFAGDSVRARIVSVVSDVKQLSTSLSPELAELLGNHCLTPSHRTRISAAELAGRLGVLAAAEKPREIPFAPLGEEPATGTTAVEPETIEPQTVEPQTVEPLGSLWSESVGRSAGAGSSVEPSPKSFSEPLENKENLNLTASPASEHIDLVDTVVHPTPATSVLSHVIVRAQNNRSRNRNIALVVVGLLLVALVMWRVLASDNTPSDPTISTDTLVVETVVSPFDTTIPVGPATDDSADTFASDTIIVDDTLPIFDLAPTSVTVTTTPAPIDETPLGIPPMS